MIMRHHERVTGENVFYFFRESESCVILDCLGGVMKGQLTVCRGLAAICPTVKAVWAFFTFLSFLSSNAAH